MKDEIRASGLWGLSLLGLVATEAAFKHGESWLEAVIEYISGNHDFVARYIQENIPQLQVIPPEATYLSWIDCRALGLPEAELSKMMMEEAKIYLDDGYVFGPEGSGFIRLNIACRRSQVEQALVRLSRAVERKLTG
jgi:cystathionine beta-lyase